LEFLSDATIIIETLYLVWKHKDIW